MANLLRKLRITKVDRVEEGANSEAHIVLFKRRDDVTHEDAPQDSVKKENRSMSVDVETLEPEVKALLVEVEKARDEAVAKAAALEAEKAEFEKLAAEPEDVLKGVPAEIRKRIEDAESEVAELRKSERRREFLAKASEFEAVGSADELAPVLSEVAASVDAETYKTLERLLKAANAQIAEGKLFDEAGTAHAGERDALNSIDEKADALVKAKSITKEQAITEVLAAEPGLYDEYRKAKESK